VSALTESDTGIRLILDAEELVEYLLTEAPDYDLDDLQMMLIRVGRNYGPYVVNELYCNGDLHPRHAQVVVPDVWSMVEHPLHALDRDEWRQLFNLAGYTHNGKRRAKPRSRGCCTGAPTRNTATAGRGPMTVTRRSGSPIGSSTQSPVRSGRRP
jgi:hypothetical protein